MKTKKPTLTEVLRSILRVHTDKPLSVQEILVKAKETALDVELVMEIDYHKVYRHLRTCAVKNSEGFFILKPAKEEVEVNSSLEGPVELTA